MTDQHKIVTFAGVQFYLVRVSPTYTQLVPVDDPQWLLRVLHQHCETK